jgi:LytR cell envelope-related transcriptional attenuator
VPLRPRSRVSVLVLNGNGTSGVAGSTASRLLGRGYASATATNAVNDGYATSLVLYRPGWAGEARRLARDARIKVVAALDGRLPAGSARAQLVLILGAN